MYSLSLSHQSNPDREIEARTIESGELVIGREPGAGWKIDDPDRAISRSHCVLTLKDGQLTVRDMSSNGIFIGAGAEAAPKGQHIPVRSGEAIRLGQFMIRVEAVAPQAGSRRESPFTPPAGARDGAPNAPSPLGDDAGRSGLGRAGLQQGSTTPPPVSEAGFDFDAPFVRPILRTSEVTSKDLAIPDSWDAGPPASEGPPSAPSSPSPAKPVETPVAATALPSDAALFEAFCAGAKLDPNAFAGEDRAAMMHKLGAVYQQMVLGLGDLLSERTSVKNEYRMIRTTVRADGNNPFKWAPPARVAVDLLRSKDDGFINGPPAVKESFEDLKKHLICLLAGFRAALSTTLTTLSPEAIESQAKGGGGFGGKSARAASAWTEFARIYADFKKQADDNPDGQINRAFRAAYERQLSVLDGLKPPR